MRLIHTSDIHYGMTPDRGKAWSSERAQAIRDTLTGLVEVCVQREADALLIAGNLFSGRPTLEDCRQVNDIFKSAGEIKIAVIAGRDDPVTANSPVKNFEWASNVSYWTDPSPAMFEEFGMKILMACGDLPADRSGYTYVAMGGKSSHEVGDDSSWAYSGSPQPMSPADTGEHGYYVVEIDDIKRKVASLTFVPYADVHYINFTIGVTPASTQAEVISNLEYAIKARGTQNIYSIKLKGMRDPGCEFNLERLKNNYRIYSIIDETEPRYDFGQLYSLHPSDMIGLFIHELNTANKSDVQKKALYYGVNALLTTKEG